MNQEKKTHEPINWVWNKKKVPLYSLEEGQLVSIKKSIIRSPNKNWFGKDSEYWIKNINSEMSDRNELVNKLKQRFYYNAVKKADIITNGIIKCFKNN
jgi:hypothetical protein